MPRPSWHALEGRDIGRGRRDQLRRDSVNIVFRPKAQPFNNDSNRGIDRGGGDLLIPLRSGRHNGLERTPFGVAFPLPQHLDGEVLRVRVDLGSPILRSTKRAETHGSKSAAILVTIPQAYAHVKLHMGGQS
jgi:hypothetical protein